MTAQIFFVCMVTVNDETLSLESEQPDNHTF